MPSMEETATNLDFLSVVDIFSLLLICIAPTIHIEAEGVRTRDYSIEQLELILLVGWRLVQHFLEQSICFFWGEEIVNYRTGRVSLYIFGGIEVDCLSFLR